VVEPNDARLLARSSWLRGSAWLAAANGTGLILSVVAGVALARNLGPEDFGLYSVVVVAISMGVVLASFRLEMHLVAQLNSGPADFGILRRAMLASGLLAVGLSGLGALITLSFTTLPVILVVLACVEVLLSPLFLARAVLQVRADQASLAVATVSNRLVWVALVWLVLATDLTSPLSAVFAARLAAVIVEAVVVVRRSSIRLRMLRPYHLRLPTKEGAVLRASTPLALAGLAGMAYNRSDQLLLASIRGRTETGIYAAGVRIADLLLFVGPIVQNVTLPGLVALHRSGNRDGMRRAVADSILMTTVPAGLAVSVLVATRGSVVPLLVGSAYRDASDVAVVLAVGAWLALVGLAMSSVALAIGERKILLVTTVAGLVVNVALNMLLLGRFGAIAAAWTSVVAYAVAVLLPALRPRLREPMRTIVGASSASMIGMVVAGAAALRIRGSAEAGIAATIVYAVTVLSLRRTDGLRVVHAISRWRAGRRLARSCEVE